MIIALIILLICIFFMLLGVFVSKSIPEKLMSLGCLTNYIIALICFISIFEGKESFVDIAYIYGLLGFAVNLGIKKLYEEDK